MKKLSLYTRVLLIFLLSSLIACENNKTNDQSEKNQCDFDFSNLSNIFNQHFEDEDMKNTSAYLTDGLDTFFIGEIDNLSIHKMDSDDRKIGLWPSFRYCTLTCAKERAPLPLLTILFDKKSSGSYSIQPIKIGYTENGKLKFKSFVKITKINFSLPDGSYFEFYQNGKSGQYSLAYSIGHSGFSEIYGQFFN